MIIAFPHIDPEVKAIGARVSRWRSLRGLTPDDLALRLGMAPEKLTQAERGQRRLNAAELYAITLHLSIPMRLLFEDGRRGP